MGDVLLDFLRVAAVDLVHLAQVAVENGAPREFEEIGLVVTPRGKVAVNQLIAQAAADRAPVLVETGDGHQVG